MIKKFIIWNTGTLLVLLYMISLYDIHRDASLILMQMMIFLTFPSGLGVFKYFGGIYYVPVGGDMVADLIFPWLGFTFFGFVQWFIILPILIKSFLWIGSHLHSLGTIAVCSERSPFKPIMVRIKVWMD
jgi:hypothetical protein